MLTEKDGQGNWCVKGLPWKNLNVGTPITKETWEKLYGCLWRLMEYEDTGLEPHQMQALLEGVCSEKLETAVDYAQTCERGFRAGVEHERRRMERESAPYQAEEHEQQWKRSMLNAFLGRR